jgi:hypothetical protein
LHSHPGEHFGGEAAIASNPSDHHKRFAQLMLLSGAYEAQVPTEIHATTPTM